VRARIVLAVSRLELRREASKRSFYFILALMVLPLVVAVLLKLMGGQGAENPRLWAGILGVDPTAVEGGAIVGLVSIFSLASWSWLVAALFGGDLLASDISDGAAQMILYRGVSRREYAVGKVLALALMLSASFLVAGVSVYGAAWVLGGPQEGLGLALLVSALIGVASLPLALVSALAGLATRKPVVGMVLGVVAYFAASIVLGFATAYYMLVARDPQAAATVAYKLGSLIPLTGGSTLPAIVYSAVVGLEVQTPAPVAGNDTVVVYYVPVAPGDFLAQAAVATAAWIIGLAALLAWYLERMDL